MHLEKKKNVENSVHWMQNRRSILIFPSLKNGLSLSLLLARSCSCIAQVSRRPSRPQALYKYPITMEFTHDTGRHLSAEDQKLLDNHRSSTSYRVSCLGRFLLVTFKSEIHFNIRDSLE